MEQGKQTLNHVLYVLLESPCRVGSNSGRNFNGDVVDIIASEKCTRAFETTSCFALAEDCFTQQVDVEANTGLAQLGDCAAQLGIGRVNDEVSHHVAQNLA